MRKILVAIAFAALIATPAFAATSHHPVPQVQSSRPLYMFAPAGVSGASRDATMQECNAAASKWSTSAWQTTQLAAYGTCMAEHGQQP
jgi:hypothetical protein